MRGGRTALPPRYPERLVEFAARFGLMAIAVVAGLTETAGEPLVLGSFGTSPVVAPGPPDAPLSSPRHAIGSM